MAYKDEEKRKKYGAGWYQRNKEKVMERNKQRRRAILDWLRRYKSTLKCIDCGIKHPAVLCFHHRDPKNKKFTISDDRLRITSLKRLQSEIEKCDVVCVNCHAKRHWREKYKSDSWEDVLDTEGETNEHRQDKTDA